MDFVQCLSITADVCHTNRRFFFLIQFYWFILAVLDLCCCAGFSLAVVHRLLFVVAALVKHRLWAHRRQELHHVGSVVMAPRLSTTGSVLVARGISCPKACGIFLVQGWNPRLLHWHADSLPLSQQGSSLTGNSDHFFCKKEFHICMYIFEYITNRKIWLGID